MHSATTTFLTTAAAIATLSGCTDRQTVTAPRQAAVTAHADRQIGGAFSSFDPPGSTLTLATDINGPGQIVGRYLTAGKTHGFLREPDGTITTVDYPGAGFTVAASINDSGAIAGWYTLPAAPAIRHGFLLQDGVFTSFDPPGAKFTNALGINERGDIVGRFCTLAACRGPGSGDFHGFVYRDGQFTILDVPGVTETDAFKLQANDAIVGGFNRSGAEGLFVYRQGEFTTLSLPNGKNVSLDDGGVNARGDIVGTYCDLPGICLIGPFPTHGFLWSDGDLTTIDYPGAQATAALGINERGDIAGGYIDANGHPSGFLLRRRN
jgi:uncharacterized membrane protein